MMFHLFLNTAFASTYADSASAMAFLSTIGASSG